MAETDPEPGPLAFAASFPPEERFALTAAELAARLAGSAGCVAQAGGEIHAAVEAAFRQAVANARANGAPVELALRASDAAFSADVACGGSCVLHWTRTRDT
jgi:hypothetical protein